MADDTAAIAAPWRRGPTRSARPSMDSRGELRGLGAGGAPICAGHCDLTDDGTWMWATARMRGTAPTREAAEAACDNALGGFGWAVLREWTHEQFLERIDPWACVWTAGIESLDGDVFTVLSPENDRSTAADATHTMMALVLAVFLDGIESGILEQPTSAPPLPACLPAPLPPILWSMTPRGTVAEVEGAGIVTLASADPAVRAMMAAFLTLQLTMRRLVYDVPMRIVDGRIVAVQSAKPGRA